MKGISPINNLSEVEELMDIYEYLYSRRYFQQIWCAKHGGLHMVHWNIGYGLAKYDPIWLRQMIRKSTYKTFKFMHKQYTLLSNALFKYLTIWRKILIKLISYCYQVWKHRNLTLSFFDLRVFHWRKKAEKNVTWFRQDSLLLDGYAERNLNGGNGNLCVNPGVLFLYRLCICNPGGNGNYAVITLQIYSILKMRFQFIQAA